MVLRSVVGQVAIFCRLQIAEATTSGTSDQIGVPPQVQRPASVAVDTIGDGLPARAVSVDFAVLQLHSGALRALGDEPNLEIH